MKAILVWGTQLTIEHHSALLAEPAAPVLLIESKAMCRKLKYHKQKLLFILTAMREYADELRSAGRTVHYFQLEDCSDGWFDTLHDVCQSHGIDELVAMRQNDRTPQQKLETWCAQQGVQLAITPNTMFLTPTSQFDEWAEGQKRLQMEMFYRWQRRRMNILMTGSGAAAKPVGGKWNYDSQNRKPLPKQLDLPEITYPAPSKHAADVKVLIEKHFASHPGALDTNWLPTTRRQAEAWLQQFLDKRFANFGDYEDAMRKGENFLYHSALSAVMNVGLLHAEDVVSAALKTTHSSGAEIPLAAKEGFIRQIIGWREFMFGLYNYFPADWKNRNYLSQHKKLPDWWWQLDASKAPEPPLVDVIVRLQTYGYSHHIERLMVLGNYMLLADYDPREVYDWFMAMYVDSYEWVMVPNIIGMSQFADGGMDNGSFATKPYISGSNYLQKMGQWWPTAAAAKESDWTQMYWQFLGRHQDVLAQNYRLRPLFAHIKDRLK